MNTTMTILQIGHEIKLSDEEALLKFLEGMLSEDSLTKDERETISVGKSTDDGNKYSIYTFVYRSETQTYFVRVAALNETNCVAKMSIYSD